MAKINYTIGDFLIRIKNASLAKKKQVESPYSNLSFSVAKVLEKLGYLNNVEKKDSKVIVNISYKNKMSQITDIKLISKPGLRIYKSNVQLKSIKSPSVLIVSTPQGVMSSYEAIKKNSGGEVIAEIL